MQPAIRKSKDQHAGISQNLPDLFMQYLLTPGLLHPRVYLAPSQGISGSGLIPWTTQILSSVSALVRFSPFSKKGGGTIPLQINHHCRAGKSWLSS